MVAMNKFIKKSMTIISVMFILAGCSDFLNTENPSDVTDEYYNTMDGQQALLNDIYYTFRSVLSTGELQYYGTDLYMGVTATANERMFDGYDATFNSEADIVPDYWSTLYTIVQETNILLSRCSLETEDMTEDDYNSFITQAKFLRALAYYYLVETFGGVPFYTTEQTEVIKEATRTSEEEIYAYIISDLDSVVDVLDWDPEEQGKVSNAAVLNLLGKLYLTRAYKTYAISTDFENATEAFDRIIDESNNELLSSYADVFDEDNQNNAEVIWAIQYGEDANYYGSGNSQQSLFGINITALLPDLFVSNQDDYSYCERGYWVNPRVHEFFTDPDLDSRYDVTFQRELYVNNEESEYYGELGIYYPTWNDDSGDDEGALYYYPFEEDGSYGWYPQSTALDILTDGSDMMPMIQKFKDTKMEWAGAGTREDIVFRMGDTYLLCAEAYYGAGQSATALKRLNTVRERAGVSDLSEIDLDVILDERARELLAEHDRWFDLKRTGKLIERAKEYNPFVAYYDNINENHLLRPIPQSEINLLDGLEQNPGY